MDDYSQHFGNRPQTPLTTINLTPELRQRVIAEHQPYVFTYKNPFQQELSCVLVYVHGLWIAFENRCPHTCAPFVTESGEVKMELNEKTLICTRHYAEFSLEDGYAVGELCAGQSIALLDVVVVGNVINIYPKSVSWHPVF